VAQDRRLPAREQCSLLESQRRLDPVANQIDAAVNLVEATALQAKPDLAGRDARLQKLPPRGDSVLLCRHGRDDAVCTPRGGFTTHNVVNPTLDSHAPGAPSGPCEIAPLEDAQCGGRCEARDRQHDEGRAGLEALGRHH
jgi:hypothetical protein